MAWTTATTRSTGYTVTAAVWNAEHVDNMNYLTRVGYQEFTGDVSLSATVVGSATNIVTAGAITLQAVPHRVEFYCPAWTAAGSTLWLILKDSSTVLGTMGRIALTDNPGPTPMAYHYTPTAASHTLSVAGWVSGAGTWTAKAGTGGTAGNDSTLLPGYIRIMRETV